MFLSYSTLLNTNKNSFFVKPGVQSFFLSFLIHAGLLALFVFFKLPSLPQPSKLISVELIGGSFESFGNSPLQPPSTKPLHNPSSLKKKSLSSLPLSQDLSLPTKSLENKKISPSSAQKKELAEKITEKTAKKEKERFSETIVATEEHDSPAGEDASENPYHLDQYLGTRSDSLDPKSLYFTKIFRQISRVKAYPSMARQLSIQGQVRLQLVISTLGELIDIQTLSFDHEILKQASVEAVRKVGKFDPPPFEIVGSSFSLIIPLRYQLR
jgi:periplasmic protein TonB